jgi:glycosyltransferase involved in cell wall biosynthesis
MKLSIVVPAYNEEAYISKCIESALWEMRNEPEEEMEIIVVNNASTDKTKEIALSYPKVIVIDEPKRGPQQARQSGFLASKGDLVAVIDADVIIPQGWIKKAINEFTKNKNLAALSGPYVYYDRSMALNMAVQFYYLLGYLLNLINEHILSIGAMIQGGNLVLRRKNMEKIGGFNTNVEFYGDDTDTAIRIKKTGKVKFSFFFPTFTSARRFSKEGILATAGKYIINYLHMIIFKKPFKYHYTYVGDVENKVAKKKDKSRYEKNIRQT